MTELADRTRIVETVRFEPSPLDRTSPIFVAGHRGLAGSAMVRRLERDGFRNIVRRSHGQLDLTDRGEVFAFFRATANSSPIGPAPTMAAS